MRPHRSRPFAALVSAVSVCLVVACGSAGTTATLGPAAASSPVAPTDPISVPASRPSAAASESPAEPTGPPTQATELDVDIDGDVRHVRLYLPDPMPDGGRPLLVFLHPFGGTPMSAVVETRLDRLSVSDGVIVAFPPADGRGWAAQVTP